MKKLPALIAVALLAGVAGWFARETVFRLPVKPAGTDGDSRRVLYFQSPMHPWIKSDKPGKCTVCGMDLVPVHDGDAPLEGGLVTLGSNAVTVVGVQTAPVARRILTRTLRFAGTIDDDDSRHRILSAYLDGRIDALFVNYEGAEVVAGQKLATFYSPMLLTAVQEYVSLHHRGSPSLGLISGAAQRLRQIGLSDPQITALPATFAETNLTVDLLAPMSGTVVKRLAYGGQYVKEGTPLFELADFATMWFKFDAYERDLVWLGVGQSVEISTPALAGRVFTNTITFIDPNFDPATRSAKGRVEIPNPMVVEHGATNRLIKHRLFAEARVRSVAPEVLTVPRSAVLNSGGAPVVYVERASGSYEPRSVQLGRMGDEVVEITGGVDEGERVVTHGNLLLDAQSQIAGLGGRADSVSSNPSPSPAAVVPAISVLDGAPKAGSLAGLSSESRKTVKEFLRAVDAARESLAADDLAGFNAAAPRLHSIAAALSNDDRLRPLHSAAGAAHLAAAGDLASARQAFYPLSTGLVEVVRGLRSSDPELSELKIYQCPMVKSAFPNAPKTAAWFQFRGPVRNPWFGPSMIDCGSELKP